MNNGESSDFRRPFITDRETISETMSETEDMGSSSFGDNDRSEPKDPITENGKLLQPEQRQYLRDLADRTYAAAQTSDGQYLQDVILAGSEGAAEELAEYITGLFRTGGRRYYAVAAHDSHVHVLHDCSYSDGSCRCNWKKKTLQQEGVEFRRRLQRQRRRGIRKLSLSDWQRIYLYFSTEGRKLKAPHINRKVQAIPDSSKDLSKSRLARPRREASSLAGKEEQDLEGDPDELRCLFENGESSGSYGGCSNAPSTGTKRKRKENQEVFSQLQSLLQQYPVAPLINIVDHPVYLESPIARYRSSSCKIQDGVDVFAKKVMRYTIEDFYTHIYSKPECVPIFSAGHVNVDDYYYDIEDSLDVINKLLKVQF